MDLLFVSLSDLHLGEEDSLLTNLTKGEPTLQPNAPSPCLLALVNYLHSIKGRLNDGRPIPYLILNGDVAELALSDFPTASTYFRLFLFEIARREIFDRIVYIPGNHDHVVWSLIRDTQFVGAIGRSGDFPDTIAMVHTTPLSLPRTSSFLDELVAGLPLHTASPKVVAAYPSLRIRSRSGTDMLFHHGHFLEDVYRTLTLLRDRIMSSIPLAELRRGALRGDIDDIERENWPWIDFVWSGFSRAGRVGQTTEAVYELLLKPGGMETLLQRIARVLDEEINIPKVPDWLEKDLFPWVLAKIAEQTRGGSAERRDPSRTPFNEDLQGMVRQFTSNFLKKDLADEGWPPERDGTVFIFGHTHKPFLERSFAVDESFGLVTIANSGGWVLEEIEERDGFHRPAVVIGGNDGQIALVSYPFSEKGRPQISKPNSWDKTLGLMVEHEELAGAIVKAASVRRPYLKARMERTGQLLARLSEQ